jgi:serine/threonine-protein kinase
MRRLHGATAGESYLAADAEAGLLDVHLLLSSEAGKDIVTALLPVAHPNLSRLRDAGIADGDIFLVEDHIEGVPLAELVRRGPLPGDVVLHITAALSSSLAEVEVVVLTQPALQLRVPTLEEILVSSVGQIKTRLTAVVALPSSADTVIELEGSMAAAAVAQAAGRPAPRRPAPQVGPAAGIGALIELLLGPRAEDEDSATRAARDLAELAQKGKGGPGDCRALHALAVAALRQALTTPTGGFVFRKLSELVEQLEPRTSDEAEVAAAGALLLAALPESTPRARKVRSWCIDSSDETSIPGRRAPQRSMPPGPPGPHVLGQQLQGTPYKLLRKLGVGGMGIVFEAEHVDLGRRVALKLLHGNLNRDPQVLARFRQEARSAARIRHPHIVEIYDFGTTSAGEVFLVMELLEGQSLTRLLRAAPQPIERCVNLLCQVCDAVEAAHKAGVIHRDLKPDNVMILPQRRATGSPWGDLVKVLDFGIAKMMDTGLGGRDGQTITRQGQLFGTPEYMAPEQILGARSDHRVDIYSLGCIAYEMFTGALPFGGESYGEMLAAHIKDPPAPPHQRAPGREIPPALSEVVLRAMAKDPPERHASMAELAEALLQAVPAAMPTGMFLTSALVQSGSSPLPITLSGTHSGSGTTPWPGPGSGSAQTGPQVYVVPSPRPGSGQSPTSPQLPQPGVDPAQEAQRPTRERAAAVPPRGGLWTKVAWGGMGTLLGLSALWIWILRDQASAGQGQEMIRRQRQPQEFAAPEQPAAPSSIQASGQSSMQASGQSGVQASIETAGPPSVEISGQPAPPPAGADEPPRSAKAPAPRTQAPPSRAQAPHPQATQPQAPQPQAPQPQAPQPPQPQPPQPQADQAPAQPQIHAPPAPTPAAANEPPPAPAPAAEPPPAPVTPPPAASVKERAEPPSPRTQIPIPWPEGASVVYRSGRLSYSVSGTTSAYGRREVQAGMEPQRAALQTCYEREVQRNPARPARGSGTFSFAISEDGWLMPGRSSASGAALPLRDCLEQTLQRSRFARPEIGPVVVTLKLDLEPIP